MKKNTVERSYYSYLRQREEWAAKGYTLYDAKTFEDYKMYYVNATSFNMPNIARTFAREDLRMTYTQMKSVRKSLQEAYSEGYEVKERRLKPGEPGYAGKNVKKYKTKRIKLGDIKGFDMENFSIEELKKMDAGEIYNKLMKFGLDERQAGGFIDELYDEGIVKQIPHSRRKKRKG